MNRIEWRTCTQAQHAFTSSPCPFIPVHRDRNAARTVLTAERTGRGNGVGVGIGREKGRGGSVGVEEEEEEEEEEVEEEREEEDDEGVLNTDKGRGRGRGRGIGRGSGCLDRAGLVDDRAVKITGHAVEVIKR